MKQQYNDKKDDSKADVPYLEEGKEMLKCIFKALEYIVDLEICSEKENVKKELFPSDKGLTECFSPFHKGKYKRSRGTDQHFSQGNTEKEKKETRLAKILLENYKMVQDDSGRNLGVCIPSPMSILYQILTVPEEPQSSAYALLFCRSLLFETFRVCPEHPLCPEGFASFNISDINQYLDTFHSITRIDQNISQSEKIPAQTMLAHFLAMKGFFYLRFGTIGRNPVTGDRLQKLISVREYLQSGNIEGTNRKDFEFHKFSTFEKDRFVEAASLMNELAGIPIPVRGAETVFQGGIRTDTNSNLVMRITGKSGSGKTSFALALCAVMSPFNTFSYYISLEEHPADLKNRLHSLIPEYLKKLSLYKTRKDPWFLPVKVPLERSGNLEVFRKNYIDRIADLIEKKKKSEKFNSLPVVCPFIIVIDSIRVLLTGNGLKFEHLEEFIEKCRKLNAIIILISSYEEAFHHEIDYMVDLVIHLKHQGTDTQKEKPTRILQLSKTRHQISRPGSHVFHISRGLRISPQLPSQIDRKEKMVKPIPSDKSYIDFFGRYNIKNKHQLKIWDKSLILLHGYGSSGKAGLSLSLLFAPLKPALSDDKNLNSRTSGLIYKEKRKVLVISLLYPEEYYDILADKILRKLYPDDKTQRAIRSEIRSDFKCLYFYSGYLTPEDFVSKILKKLDTAILEGDPFTGILFDGLHNVSLQFHKLQESDMVWPTLYSLLVKYHLTIVTTFTNFTIENKTPDSGADQEILLRGHKPLLHALVQATDYYFTVQKITEGGDKGKYKLSLKSAIRHMMKGDEAFTWDRENVMLSDYENEKMELTSP